MKEFTTLIEPQDLYDLMLDDDLIIVDCRYQLADDQAGEIAYRSARIPGACYAHLSRDLSGPGSTDQGRHPLPDPEVLADRFSSWGIGNNAQVIAYDDAGGAMAARLWWLLRWLGHGRVALLNGGWPRWLAKGRTTEVEVKQPAAAKFSPQLQESMTVQATELLKPEWLVLDARGPKRFSGEEEPMDKKAGHIPGARNYPYANNLDGQDCFKSAGQLRAQLLNLIEDFSPGRAVFSCGSGVSACHNLLAMEIADLGGSRLYPPSWSGWIANPDHPIETGNRPAKV